MAGSRQFVSLSQSRPPYFAGVDVGGQTTKVGIVDDDGRPLFRTSFATSTAAGPDADVVRMADAVRGVADQAEIRANDLAFVGLATPGTMDIPAGKFIDPPNLPGWQNYPIRDRLSEACNLPVTYANDAGAAAFGEYWIGSGKEFPSIILLTLGTGLGGGIIVGDRLIEGVNSHGSELGHIIIDHSETARMCPCGQPGHLEAYVSAKSLVKRATQSLESGAESTLQKFLDGGDELTPLLLAQQAEAGDQLSQYVILEMARYLGVGVVSLMHTIDPGAVILGGSMDFGGPDSELGGQFIGRVREEVRRRAFPIPAQRTTIKYASLGGDAGFIGAAGIARTAYHSS